ncbi:MAG: hypothetical protein PUC50_17690 [Bacteroidales bacterium]|nr:hypothetical protein [Bacteroidales bacterium]
MKKLSYYVAAFVLCCGVSQTLTSCVDETEEPDYVKQVREAEMKAEIAKNNKDAKQAGKESEAAFTEAFLNGTLSNNTSAYKELETALSQLETAESEFKAVEALTKDPSWIKTKANEVANLKAELPGKQKAVKDAKTALSDYTGDDAVVKATYQKAVDVAEAELKYTTDLLDQYTTDAFTAAQHDYYSTWKDLYEDYLYAKENLAKKQAKYDEKKAIYDKAIEGMQQANN